MVTILTIESSVKAHPMLLDLPFQKKPDPLWAMTRLAHSSKIPPLLTSHMVLEFARSQIRSFFGKPSEAEG